MILLQKNDKVENNQLKDPSISDLNFFKKKHANKRKDSIESLIKNKMDKNKNLKLSSAMHINIKGKSNYNQKKN